MTYNDTLNQGETWIRTYRVKNSDGSLYSLTGCTVAMMIRQDYSDPTPLISLSSPSSGIVIDTVAATITVTITSTVTAAIAYRSAASLVYDIEVTQSGIVTRIVQGSIAFSPEVTR
jgi:hypothetical protein